MDPLNEQNILIQEAVVNSLNEDNSGNVHQENDPNICLLSNTDVSPPQMKEAQGCNVLNIQSNLDQGVMLLTENEDDSFAHPPSKKLKTEQNMQAEETVADCLIDNQADKESENKITEDEFQQSDTDILPRTTNLLPEDSEETATSSGGYHNRIDCFYAAEKIKINEAKEITEIFTANSQEQTSMDQQSKQLNYEVYHINSHVESPNKERIILEDLNKMPQNQEISLNEEYFGKINSFSLAKEANKSETGSERNKTASDETSSENYVKEIAVLLTEDKSNLVENEQNTKPETLEECISSNTISDNHQNHNDEENNVTSSDVITVSNVADCEENGFVIPAENGNEVVDTAAERNLHTIIFEHKTSWPAKLQDEVFKLVDVPCDSATYTEIKSLFQNTTQKHFQLNKIVEVQNPFLYGCYLLKKAEMESRYGHIKEEYLFHGTKVKNISSICEQNLDWRKHGSVTGNIFGKGASLTPISCYASHYSDKYQEERIMFVFKVVIANETIGDPDMVIPPYKDTFKKLRYDTAIKPNRQVVVKFSDHEFYPEYLLYYTGKYRRYVYYDDIDDSD